MIIAILLILGLCFGSFINALVWRTAARDPEVVLPKPNAKLIKAKQGDMSMATGHSMCTRCYHRLAWYDLVPLLSWLSLKGKCRYCKQPIGRQYPAVELLTAVLFVISYLAWPYGFDASGLLRFGFWLTCLVGLVAMAVYDLRWYLLPNKFLYPLIGLGVLHALAQVIITGKLAIILSTFFSILVAGGIFWVIYQINDNWIGGGDIKLGVLIGLILMSPDLAFLMLFIASLIGCIVSIPVLMVKRKYSKTAQIPFGPFLIAGTLVCLLFGTAIIDWYTGLFLIS